ncbi:MAG: hypothetical protein ACE5I7_12580 [Candidatus Binatia bacterium]
MAVRRGARVGAAVDVSVGDAVTLGDAVELGLGELPTRMVCVRVRVVAAVGVAADDGVGVGVHRAAKVSKISCRTAKKS